MALRRLREYAHLRQDRDSPVEWARHAKVAEYSDDCHRQAVRVGTKRPRRHEGWTVATAGTRTEAEEGTTTEVTSDELRKQEG